MNSATKLNFDLLGHIFHHYAETETATHPLETLLLVSRSWSEAALGHRALWSHFKIYIALDHENTSIKVWKVRLPLRLKRCGDTIPLHIDLRLPNAFNFSNDYASWKVSHFDNGPSNCTVKPSRHNPIPMCECLEEAFLCIDDFLPLLAGERGELCRRWESFQLEIRSPKDPCPEYRHLRALFRHPMPILTSLVVVNLGLKDAEGIFPHTPLLEHLTWLSSVDALPSRKSVRSLKIVQWQMQTFGNGLCPQVQVPSHIEELVLDGKFRCPKSTPKLWNLDISGTICSPQNDVVELPNLTHLTLHCHNYCRSGILPKIQHQNFSQVISLGLYRYPGPRSLTSNGEILQILRAAKALSSIHGNYMGISVVLKLVSEEPEWEGSKQGRLLNGRKISLMVHPSSALLHGDESWDQLCDVAKALKVDPPDDSWDSILSLPCRNVQ